MAESKQKTEALVGVFIFIGLSLLGVLVLQFGRFGERFHHKYQLTIIFTDAAGLIKGSEVRMGGAKIGSVAATPMLNDNVKVEASIDIDERIRIPDGSAFQIASATILGDKLIIVTPPESPSGDFIEPDSVIMGGGPSGLDAIQNNAEALSRDAREILDKAALTLEKIDGTVDEIRLASKRLAESMEKINTSLLSEENLRNINRSLANFEKASGELGPTLTDAREAIASIEKAADGASETFASASERIDELEPALKEIPKAVASLSRAADQASSTLESVESGNGLIGTLAYDKEVSEDAKTFIRNLKQQGILRYRDKESETPEDDPRSRFRGQRR